jgi:FimV-like protein
MLTDKYIEKLLDLYFKGELSQEEKDKLFESLRSNPSLNDTVQFVLSHTDPSKAELFLSEKSLMCDTQLISEEDETMIELYLSGMMSQEEEADFMDKLVSDADLRTNMLAQAFLVKAIQKIHNADNKALDAAKQTTVSDVKSLFKELQDEDDDRLIDSYLIGKLSEEEIKSFEERLKFDKDFRERVSAITFLSKGIKERQERDAKAIEDAKKISKEDVISTIREMDKLGIAAYKHRTIIPIWFRHVAAAAVVLIVFGVGFDYYNSSVMMSNAGECIEFASTQLPQEIHDRSDGEDLHELFKNVQLKKDLKETIDELEGYYSTDSHLDQVRLALATAYLYDGQKSKAKDMLNEIIKDSEASPDIKEKAKQLLESIKKTFIF